MKSSSYVAALAPVKYVITSDADMPVMNRCCFLIEGIGSPRCGHIMSSRWGNSTASGPIKMLPSTVGITPPPLVSVLCLMDDVDHGESGCCKVPFLLVQDQHLAVARVDCEEHVACGFCHRVSPEPCCVHYYSGKWTVPRLVTTAENPSVSSTTIDSAMVLSHERWRRFPLRFRQALLSA
jgi:hypothetical protein